MGEKSEYWLQFLQRNLICVVFLSIVKRTVIKSILCTSLCCSLRLLPNQGKRKMQMCLTTLKAQLKWTYLYSFSFSLPEIQLSQRFQEFSTNKPVGRVLECKQVDNQLQAKLAQCAATQWHDAMLKKAVKKVRPSHRNRLARWHRAGLPSMQNTPSCR